VERNIKERGEGENNVMDVHTYFTIFSLHQQQDEDEYIKFSKKSSVEWE
jgi:hypothetical protein